MKIFRKTSYVNGIFYQQKKDTVKVATEKLDLYFFRRHFLVPYYLPMKLNDGTHKNQTISIWRNPNDKKDYLQNWEDTYTYDSLGRITKYTYSGCFICSNLPYEYNVSYNSAGLIEAINETKNMRENFKFKYDKKGSIIKIEKFTSNELQEVVELMN